MRLGVPFAVGFKGSGFSGLGPSALGVYAEYSPPNEDPTM